MDKASVAYVLCRIEDDASLTPVSQHEDYLTGIAAGGYVVEVEDLEFAYALYAGHPSNGSSTTRVASFREGRIGYREWAHEEWAYQPQRRGSLRPRCRRAYGMRTWPLQEGVPTRSAPACDASRDVFTT
jgi:hypothetical protein